MRLRRTRAVPALARLAGVLLLLVPRTAGAQTGELPEELRTIERVRFSGVHALGSRQLKAANLRTHKPSILPWRDKPILRRDYLRADSASIVSLYSHYGYLGADVRVRLEPTRDPRNARVVFEVREGPLTRVSRVEFTGVAALGEGELRRQVLARPGVPFDPAFLQLDTLKIRSLYREHGRFVSARGDTLLGVPDATHLAIVYHVEEGPQYQIGAIQFPETPHVRASLGRRELLVKPGEVYRETRLGQSVERLYQTNLYRQVQVTAAPDSSTHRVDLDFLVNERKRRWVDAGVGSGTSDRIRLTNELGHRNLDTRALSGVADGELAFDGYGKFRKAGAAGTLTEPWLLGIRLMGQAGLFYRREDDRSSNYYVQHLTLQGFNFSLYRELSRIARFTLLEENSLVHQSYGDTANKLLPDTTRARLDSLIVPRYRTNTLRGTLERDTRNDRLTPHLGSYQTLVGEYAGGPLLKGQTSYRKLVLSSTWYSPRRNGWLLAFRAAGGAMDPFGRSPEKFAPDPGVDPRVARVPRESRFFVGGVNSLRGYGENSIPSAGGLAMLLGNVEARIPLAGPFGLEVFIDAGNVWARPEYVRAKDFVAPWQATRVRNGDLRYTYGVGGRLVLPFGPLRVDLAWSDRPDFPRTSKPRKLPFAFQFAIGPSF